MKTIFHATTGGRAGLCNNRRWALAVTCAVSLSSVPAGAEELTATPYRPTVSNPADLSAPGHVEWEAGVQRDRGGPSVKRASVPWVLKYAFTDTFGVLVGGEGVVSQTDINGDTLRGGGDTALIAKFKFPVNAGSAFGVEAGRKFPTAKLGLGSDKADYTVNGIYSVDAKPLHADINMGYTRLGAVDPEASRHLYSWATAISCAVNDRWGVSGEVSGQTQPGAADTTQFLWALTYNLSPRVVLDAGTAWGLNTAAPDTTVFAGVTMLFK